MNIHILDVDNKFQPKKQIFRYPTHNHDYGVEQDFLQYLNQINKTDISSKMADWHYLPIFWTRWHLNNDYGQKNLELLQQEVDKVIVDDSKTFTICQYDDGPLVKLGKAKVFLSSRKSNSGYDIPLLSKKHIFPLIPPSKKILASFIGRSATHPIREDIFKKFSNTNNCFIFDGDLGFQKYRRIIAESYVTLSPRGYGGSSFRFYEAMQLGSVPFLIGDIDTRPFKEFINWNSISWYSDTVDDILNTITNHSKYELKMKGKEAKKTYFRELHYQKWCKFVIKELERL